MIRHNFLELNSSPWWLGPGLRRLWSPEWLGGYNPNPTLSQINFSHSEVLSELSLAENCLKVWTRWRSVDRVAPSNKKQRSNNWSSYIYLPFSLPGPFWEQNCFGFASGLAGPQVSVALSSNPGTHLPSSWSWEPPRPTNPTAPPWLLVRLFCFVSALTLVLEQILNSKTHRSSTSTGDNCCFWWY